MGGFDARRHSSTMALSVRAWGVSCCGLECFAALLSFGLRVAALTSCCGFHLCSTPSVGVLMDYQTWWRLMATAYLSAPQLVLG